MTPDNAFRLSLKGARQTHAWDLSPKQAIQIQEALKNQVLVQSLDSKSLKYVAGVDVGFPRGKEIARAAIALMSYPDMKLVDQGIAELPVSFPYVPGLLSFREIPVILAALETLNQPPDLLITDGHGMAHPRSFGLACHLGVLLNLPTLGCAKSVLVGTHNLLPEARGSSTPLCVDDETIGMVVRTRDRVKPVYISVGHRIDLSTAVEIVLKYGAGYRLPEPTRWAHRLASDRKNKE